MSPIPPQFPMPADSRPRIAVFSGPTATIQNSEPLVTSNKARARSGLPLLTDPGGQRLAQDIVRPQRLAAPVTVYIEAFSAHPLESDGAELYAPPDGYLSADGTRFSEERVSDGDTPVYEVELTPQDGLLQLPYMALTRDGRAWDHQGLEALSGPEESRQTFYPDASRIFEEIDRFGLDESGCNNMLASRATFDFFRAAPSAGYLQGLAEASRTDTGEGDIPPEVRGEDFFYYRPYHIAEGPSMPTLARLTNMVQHALASGEYQGAIWLEGSPAVEESAYWLNLLIDTTVPIACNASQRPHGALANDGDRNIVDSVDYVRSRISVDASGVDAVGAVLIQDEQIFAARDGQKADARPGGYVATGGHGGIIGTIGAPGAPMLTYWPAKAHTHRSEVNLNRIPHKTSGVARIDGKATMTQVQIKDDDGDLLASAIPKVTFAKFGRYGMDDASDDPDTEVEILSRIERNLERFPLSGFVLEGNAPFGRSDEAQMAALRIAIAHGMPVVQVGRGNAEGMVPTNPASPFVAGSNLTANKARLLLMACLLRFGCPPPASDPRHVTESEWLAIRGHLTDFLRVFSSH